VGKALAILPPGLSAATKDVTTQLIATLDAHMDASSATSPAPKTRGSAGEIARGEGAGQDALLFELQCHDQVRKRHVAHFVAADKTVEDVCHYVFDRPSHNRPVYVVEGEARGLGVSAVMANIAERLTAMMAERKLSGRVITRFVGATEGSRHVEPLVHGILLEMQGLMALDASLGDEFDKKGNGPGLARLLQQTQQWFRKLRAQQAVVGGLAELNQDIRNLAELASAKKPLVIIVDALDCLVDPALDSNWDPSFSAAGAGAGVAGGGGAEDKDGQNDILWRLLERILGWLPVSTLKGQDPLLPPHVRVVVSHNSSCQRISQMVHKLLKVRGTTRVLRGLPVDEKSLISAILREMNQRAGGGVSEAALASLLPPLLPDAGDVSSPRASISGGESSGIFASPLCLCLLRCPTHARARERACAPPGAKAHVHIHARKQRCSTAAAAAAAAAGDDVRACAGVTNNKPSVSYESLWLALAMNRMSVRYASESKESYCMANETFLYETLHKSPTNFDIPEARISVIRDLVYGKQDLSYRKICVSTPAYLICGVAQLHAAPLPQRASVRGQLSQETGPASGLWTPQTSAGPLVRPRTRLWGGAPRGPTHGLSRL